MVDSLQGWMRKLKYNIWGVEMRKKRHGRACTDSLESDGHVGMCWMWVEEWVEARGERLVEIIVRRASG